MSEASPRPLAALYAGTLDCVHCGLCLPACPTYRETGRETSSPRGRVALMRGVAEGRLPLGPLLAEEAYLCLGCRACETACPSGVRFGSLLEQTRAEVDAAGLRRGWRKRLEVLALRDLLPHPRRLRVLVQALAAFQGLGLPRLARRLLPGRLGELAGLLPEIPPRRERLPLPARIPAMGTPRGRVMLFTGCIMPELFGAVNAATARVLAHNGFEVEVPSEQGCCGALQAHAGEPKTAHELARRNLGAFDASKGSDASPGDLTAIISNSAGCGAALREYAHWLPGEGDALSGRVQDICAFLDAVGLVAPPAPETSRAPLRVCYDDPCHLVHGQGVGEAPRRLVEALPGVELVPHDDPTSCCGAAGIYNITHPAMSRDILDRKLDSLAAADPDVVVSGNPGCLMQLRSGLGRRGLGAEVLHPVELLDRAYAAARPVR